MDRFYENKLGKKLLQVREGAKLSQGQLVALMKKRGIDVKAYTISKWETGISKPSVEAFLAICEICKVEDIRYTFVGKRLLRLYNIPVSAGPGNYLEGNDYEMIEADDLTPDAADYALRVNGESMMPRFVDQQIVFIHEQPVLNEGEIGIFCLNNEAYLKKLGRGCLISLNPEYDPIPIHEHDELKVFGKVVGQDLCWLQLNENYPDPDIVKTNMPGKVFWDDHTPVITQSTDIKDSKNYLKSNQEDGYSGKSV